MDGLAYPLPQILHTFFPSEEESGEEGEEKPGDTAPAPAPAPMLPSGSNTSWGTVQCQVVIVVFGLELQTKVLEDVKAQEGAFNQEKALVGAFSMIRNLRMDLRFEL